MSSFKAVTFIVLIVFGSASPIYAQDKGDIGVIFTGVNNRGLALEYRHPINDKFRMLTGLFVNSTNQNLFPYNTGEIIAATDSTVTERYNVNSHTDAGLRFGVSDQLGSSVFSMGADVNVAYRNQREGYFNETTVLHEDGTWRVDYQAAFPIYENPGGIYISRHFLIPSLRLVLNADVPLGQSLLIHFEMAGSFALPIYMGASRIQGPEDIVIGVPPSVFDSYLSGGIGLRYNIGSRK